MLSAPFAVGDSSFSVNSQGYRGKALASTTAWATSRQRRKSALGWPILALRVTAVLEAQRESEEHTSELQSPDHLVCRLRLEKKNILPPTRTTTRYPFALQSVA